MADQARRYSLAAWVRAIVGQGTPAAPVAPASLPWLTQPTAPADSPAPPTRQWHALPGNVIELGSTGFSIQLDTRPDRPLYMLRAPEGFVHGWGSDLVSLKTLGERFAAERDEFVWHPKATP